MRAGHLGATVVASPQADLRLCAFSLLSLSFSAYLPLPFSARAAKRAKFGKNPSVDTSFLPDREREEQERKIREELRKQFLKEQEETKKEDIEIVCSYWDGSGHRTQVTVSLPAAALTALLELTF